VTDPISDGYYVLGVERAARGGETDVHGTPANRVGFTVYPIHPREHVVWAGGRLGLAWWEVIQRAACRQLRCEPADLVWWAGFQPGWTLDRVDALVGSLGEP
jgi:hypothetical protein